MIAAPSIRVNCVSPGVLLTVCVPYFHMLVSHLALLSDAESSGTDFYNPQDWGLSFPPARLEAVKAANKLKRFATVEDVAEQVKTFVASKTVTGQNSVIDGGFSL